MSKEISFGILQQTYDDLPSKSRTPSIPTVQTLAPTSLRT